MPDSSQNDNQQIRETDNSFEGDFFKRKTLAIQLSEYMEILKKGAVIAIDAPWGSGKTWFGNKWKDYLENQKHHKVIFIDAFKNDYIEDPFILIAAEINLVVKNSNNDSSASLIREAKTVIKYLAPLGAKIATNGTGNIFFGISNLQGNAEELAKQFYNKISEDTSAWVEKKFNEYENEKKSLTNYSKELEKFCETQDKPVVIFIDELDRCKPTFAIKLIERIKHFFDVPGIIFILLMNRKQLENAIKGCYGTEKEDAKDYLSKFINLFLHLPQTEINAASRNAHENTKKFVRNILENNYNIPLEEKEVINFIEYLTVWSYIKSLTLRQIERACTIFAITGAKGNSFLITYLIVLKMLNYEIFIALVQGLSTGSDFDNSKQSIEEAIKNLEQTSDLQRNEIAHKRNSILSVIKELLMLLIDKKYDLKITRQLASNYLDIDIEELPHGIEGIFLKNIKLIDLQNNRL
jgi:KAP family P-loop domain